MKATKVLLSQAVPGMVVSEDILTRDHNLVISKDTVLTDKIITRLEFYNITDISIYSDTDTRKQEAGFIESTFYNEIKKSEAFKHFHKAYVNALGETKKAFDKIANSDEEIDTGNLLSDISKILYESKSNISLFNMLHCIRQYDDTTYMHSLNVSLICNIIGKWLRFSPEDLEIITQCGLLHDVGKVLIPTSIIMKPTRLTEEEFTTIKTHTIRGYNLLKNRLIDRRIKNVALMHHERCDGSGYPYGLLSQQIEPFAKLVAIADVYDAMTCARVYRGPLCPFEVVSLFEAEGYTKYEAKYIFTFLEGIVQTYINNNVRLSNKTEGEIVMINKFDLSRPVVKVGEEFIDLSRNRDIHIEALI
jgi:putative nucleotidyltransferase with HDIG domain